MNNYVDTAFLQVVSFNHEIEDAFHDEYPDRMERQISGPVKGMGAEAIPLLQTGGCAGHTEQHPYDCRNRFAERYP